METKTDTNATAPNGTAPLTTAGEAAEHAGPSTTGAVAVVGGYGAVGRAACLALAERFPGRVFVAGRSLAKAEALSRETGGGALPLMVDLADPARAAEAVHEEGARVVVGCVETGDAGFAREVLGRGMHYVDVSASDAHLRGVEGLDALAARNGATAVLSVGLSPGVTNLLAKHCVDALGDELGSIDVSVLLGLGEAHGEAAVRWTVENLDGRFAAPGAPGTVGSLTDPKRAAFPGPHGSRACYRFDFADQHVLARTLGAERAATRLCFDSAAATRLLVLAKRAGVFRALGGPRGREVLVALLSRLRLGSDGFAVKVEAEGKEGGRHSCSVWGRGEGRATGAVAALVAEGLLAAPPSGSGVFHVEQLLDPEEFFAGAEGHGISVDLGPSTAP